MIFCKKLFWFVCLNCVFLLNVGFVSALEIHYPDILGKSVNDTSTFPEYACYLFSLITALAIFIAVIVIAFGGVYYLIFYGRGKFTSEGKDWMKAGITGLLIIVCAYLIAYTINPNLTICSLNALSPIDFNFSSSSTIPPGATITTYKEIPIGTLTENLLTRTMDCYGFDPEGNPINGDQITIAGNKKINGPTYTNHDRADCLVQLVEGAQKKAQVIASLSDNITRLMNLCSCRIKDADGKDTGASKCDPVCDYAKGGCKVTKCPGGKCVGTCVDGACKQPPNTYDCCPKDSGVKDPKNPQKNLSVKDLIERGPINLSEIVTVSGISVDDNLRVSVNDTPVYSGSFTQIQNGYGYGNPQTTFTTQRDDTIKIELIDRNQKTKGFEDITINNDKICSVSGSDLGYWPYIASQFYGTPTYDTIINTTLCDMGLRDCGAPEKKYNGLDEFRCPNPNNKEHPSCENISDYVSALAGATNDDGTPIYIIDKNKWNKLNLVQQLVFFKEEIEFIKQEIQKDKDALEQAETALGNCYLAIPYVDLVKTYENANQQNHIILTQKTFSDPITDKIIDVSKYCEGFNYANSSCLKKCNDMCPDTSPAAMACYQGCEKCKGNDTACLNRQEKCVENCYNARPCTNASGENPPKTFGVVKCGPNLSCPSGLTCDHNTNTCVSNNPGKTPQDCISSCQNACANKCSEKYLECSYEYRFCQSQCKNDSQCVLDNADKCLFGAGNFQQCANQITDQGNTDYCIDNAYLCKNGSDQYAWYSDCGKCPKPYDPPKEDSVCYSKTNTTASCQELCPETTKCPASSKCPDCPCDQISNPKDPTKPLILYFSVLYPSVKEYNTVSKSYSKDKTGNAPTTRNILVHQIVGPECNEYSYNDDPLTFYCEDSWWTNPNREGLSQTPIGTERICPKEKDVPVGQTVDDAEKWASDIIHKMADETTIDLATNGENGEFIMARGIIDSIQIMIDQMIKIGDAYKTSPVQDYCKCNAMLENGEPICKTGCQYHQTFVKNVGWACNCTFVPCKGNPCQQITDYLSILWWDYEQLISYSTKFYTYMLKEPRSDIMKELTYSRKTTNECSLTSSAYGIDTRLLSCTRVEDELIAPINTGQIEFNNQTIDAYCYGKELGKLSGASLADDWFCCEEWSKNPTISNNPIYNIQK